MASSLETGSPVLEVSIRLGRLPRVDEVGAVFASLESVWRSSMYHLRPYFVEPHELPQPVTSHLDPLDPGAILRLRRISLNSPLEILLVTAADRFVPIVYAAAGLVALERALRLVRDWQMMRLDIRERRAQVLMAEQEADELLDQHLSSITAEMRAQGRSPRGGEPFLRSSVARDGIRRLSSHPVERATLRPDDS
jgi:hypothetical protein